MPFITDPDLDRFMGRHAPRGGAFAALLCLAQLAPDAPAPLEILIQALNAWWDDQQDDLMTMLEGLEERDRVIIADGRAGTIITVMPELLPEVERQLTAIPDEQRATLLAGVRADVDTALTELVFDVGDPSPAQKEAWCRMFIPHLLHRVTNNLALLPYLANAVAHYEPARFDTVAQLIPAYLDALPTFDPADPAVDAEEDADDRNVEQAFVAMHVEMLLQDACLAVEGVNDSELRRRFQAVASDAVAHIERHRLERSLTGRLRYASLVETPLDEAQSLLLALFERLGDPQTSGQQASRAHRVAATWLRRLRRDAPSDPVIAQLLPSVDAVTFADPALDEYDPELELGVAECYLVRAAIAIDAGEVERAIALLAETMDRIAEGADIGVFDDDADLADRLIADLACMRAQLMVQRGDLLQARHSYTLAIDTLRREHGRQHQLVRHIENARRRLGGKRMHIR
jgi:hypothetical protein